MSPFKKQLRIELKAKRRALTPTEIHRASQKITQQCVTSDVFKQSQHIACYYPMHNEVDTELLMEDIWEKKKACYLPVLDLEHHGYLKFIRYRHDTPIQKNRLGIIEPDTNELIKPEDLDLVFMPLVAFDDNGNRVGSGAGYYDRTFAFKQQTPHAKPTLIGLGYGFQRVDEIKTESFDVRLDAVKCATI